MQDINNQTEGRGLFDNSTVLESLGLKESNLLGVCIVLGKEKGLNIRMSCIYALRQARTINLISLSIFSSQPMSTSSFTAMPSSYMHTVIILLQTSELPHI